MAGIPSTTYDVYVANIPIHYNETQIRDIFDVAGEIAGVKIIPPKPDRDGKIAFVKFLKEADALCVAQYMSNYECSDGTNLMVRYKPPPPPLKSPNKVVVNGKIDEPVQTSVKVEETATIYVCHVESAIEFFGHTYNKELATKLDALTKSMEALCPSQPKVIGQLSVDKIFGCKFSVDGMWYRCKILKCLPKNEIHVRYIDYGNCEVTNRFGLVTLPAEVLDLPPLCAFYQVNGVRLIDDDQTSELYVKGLELLKSLINEQRIELKFVKKEKDRTLVDILKVLDGATLDVPERILTTGAVKKTVVTERKQAAFGKDKPPKSLNKKQVTGEECDNDEEEDNKHTPIISYKNLLNEYAQKNNVTLPSYVTVPQGGKYFATVTYNGVQYKGINICEKRKDAEKDAAQVALNALIGTPPPIPGELFEQDEMNGLDEYIMVYVSHVESPLQFWGQLYNTELEETLLNLTNTMEEICPTLPKLTEEPADGIHACQFSQDGLWYRCKVEKITNDEVYVRYIDYGNAETTSKANLVNLPEELAKMVPLCKLYTVAGLELINKKSTSETFREGLHALHDVIGEQKIQVKVMGAEDGEPTVHINRVLDGPLLDVETFLLVSGAVRKKNEKKSSTPLKKILKDFDEKNTTAELVRSPSGTHKVKFADSVETEDRAMNSETNDENDVTKSTTCPSKDLAESTGPSKDVAESAGPSNDMTKSTSPLKDVAESTTISSNDVAKSTCPSKDVAKSTCQLKDEETSMEKDIATNTNVEGIDVETNTDLLAQHVETSTKSVQKDTEVKCMVDAETSSSYDMKDAQTNTMKEKSSQVEGSHTPAAAEVLKPSVVEDQLDKYVREIEQKKEEIQHLKKTLCEKTKLVDDYLKKIPTPGSKRDLWEIYDEVTVDVKDRRNEHLKENIAIKEIASYKKEIEELDNIIEATLLHEQLFIDVGVKPPRGVLICGPRGTGKTMIARGVANNAKASVVELQGQILMCELTADINTSLCKVFQKAEKKNPVIIIIDELDKIAPKRVTEKSRIVVSYLINAWNNLKRHNKHIVIATANGEVDPALKRYGLFERELIIRAPDVHQRVDILNILTRRMNLHTDVNIKKVAEETAGYVASDLATLCNVAGMEVIRRKMAAMKLRKEEGFLMDKGGELSTISITVGMADFKYAISSTKPSLVLRTTSKHSTATAKHAPTAHEAEKLKSDNLQKDKETMERYEALMEYVDSSPTKKCRDLVSDSSEIETLNESFESCDSNLGDLSIVLDDGDETLDEGGIITKASHDVMCDNPSYRDGEELEGWNTALLKKKPRDQTEVTSVDFNCSEDFF